MTAFDEMQAVPGAPRSRSAGMRRALARAGDTPLREGNQLTLLRNGPDTFDEWLAEIGRAERWVHLENYFFLADEFGRWFAEALCERAAAGVKVRVLYDWFGSMSVPESYWRRLEGAGVEVRAVNPPAFGAPLRAVSRDHRKIVGVDGRYASTGGVCIAEGWLQRSPETGLPYRDIAVGMRGPAVADLEQAFARLWDQAGAPLPDEERPTAEGIRQAGEQAVCVIGQEPGKMRVLRLLEFMLAVSEERFWIADPYFLSTPLLNRSLIAAAEDGVDVRLLLPATNDRTAIAMLSRTGYRQLLEAGVRIHEYGGPMMHAKTSVVDGRWSRVGSTNLNFSSLLANWEIDLFVEDGGFGEQMEDGFEQDFSSAREIQFVSSGEHPETRPDRPIDGEHGAERGPHGGFTRVAATFSRVSSVVLGQSIPPLRAHERAIGGGVGAAVLAASLAGARFPRLVAWPLAAAGIAAGVSEIVHAVRPLTQNQESEDPPREQAGDARG
ncbi:phospholipase D-like domain-containing protein [soil metagenome]